jgi:drug/metabolite transporter (DMT)-like permease
MYALFAATFPIQQHALRFTTPLLMTSVRMFLAGGILLIASLLWHKQRWPSRRDWQQFVILSFFYIYLSFIPELWAQQYLTPLTTNLMYSTTPLIALILEWFLLKQSFTSLRIMAITLGFIGMIPLFCIDNVQDVLAISPFPFLPEAVLMVGVISTCYAWFLVRKINEEGYGLLFINGIAMLIGGCMCLITVFAIEGLKPSLLILPQTCMLCIAALILFSNILGYLLYGFLLRIYSVSFLSFAGFLSPIFGAFYAWTLGLERLSWHHLFAFICITIGLGLLYHEEQRKKTNIPLKP